MTDFTKVANEVLDILKSFNYTVTLYDDTGMRVNEPDDARRFFDKSKNLMVAVVDDDDNSSIDLSYGMTTHANDIMGLDQALNVLATKSNLLSSAKQFGKQIEPQDVSMLGSITEKQDKTMILALTEGMYGTTRSSYLRLENARMIVRHSKKINDSVIGARGRCVESIFIENASGERLLFPSTHLAPARAMTQHVNHGGTFADPVGSEIMQMTTEYANLAQASNFVASNAIGLTEGAVAVREACRGRMRECRKSFGRLAKTSSYARESASMLEQANTLNETGAEIDETQISEIRRLLNDADLPREVYECASKAMSRMKESAPITEAENAPANDEADDKAKDGIDYEPPEGKTVGVLGYRVDVKAWNEFKENKLFVTGAPKNDDEFVGTHQDQFAKLCYMLGRWVPVVADVTLANLLSHVVDQMMLHMDGEIPNGGISRSGAHYMKQQADWHNSLRTMGRIAIKALQAKKIKAPLKKAKESYDGDGAGVMAVVEHFDWLNKFDPEIVLAEDFGMGDWGDPIGNGYDDIKSDMIAKFDPQDFANSPEVNEIVGGKNPQDPDQNHLDHHEVMAALTEYLQREMQSMGSEDSFSLYMTDTSDDQEIADALYDDACEALQGQGWIVQNLGNVEESTPGADDFDLDMSDILIPAHDQGNSLVRQVSKAEVDDPDHPDHHMKPDNSYVSRLMTLAGMQNGGQSGQNY